MQNAAILRCNLIVIGICVWMLKCGYPEEFQNKLSYEKIKYISLCDIWLRCSILYCIIERC